MNRSPFFSGMCAPSQANQYIQLIWNVADAALL
jgi:hypothetical protein